MKQRIAAILVATVFFIDGLTHLYWAAGNIWPAPDARALSLAVLNVNIPFKPLNLIPLACLLFAGTLIMLMGEQRFGKIEQRIPDLWLRLGRLAIAAGLLLRGGAGIVWITGLGADMHTPFYWLNLIVYTPLCVLLFIAVVMVILSQNPKKGVKSFPFR